MAQTIKNMTGISFDGAAIINFGGFKNVIDTLGTVRICVSHEVKSHHMMIVDGKPMWNADAKKTGQPMTPVVHKKGCREMKGWAGARLLATALRPAEQRLRPAAEPAAADQGDGPQGHRQAAC